MRARFFGPRPRPRTPPNVLNASSVARSGPWRWTSATPDAVERVFAEHASDFELVIHTAAQPSHDWAASDPQTDFTVNANGTLNLLEATRHHAPGRPSSSARQTRSTEICPISSPDRGGQRLELPRGPSLLRRHRHLDVDRRSTHSLFGVSKAAADLLVQEYGRYFEHAHGVLPRRLPHRAQPRRHPAHGFLSYLMRCTMTGDPYTVFGYGGQAGARQHPLGRPGGGLRTPFTAPRGRRRSTTSAAAARATARCSRRSTSASRSPDES